MPKPNESLITLFGRRLRQIRKEKGLTQEQLALQAGCDPSYLGMVERGMKSISLRIIEKLCNALRILPVELFVLSPIQNRKDVKDVKQLKEQFLSLVHDPSINEMLSIAMDNIAKYQSRKKST